VIAGLAPDCCVSPAGPDGVKPAGRRGGGEKWCQGKPHGLLIFYTKALAGSYEKSSTLFRRADFIGRDVLIVFQKRLPSSAEAEEGITG
jgi:hypothetical protein